jgi:hypothetical protein
MRHLHPDSKKTRDSGEDGADSSRAEFCWAVSFPLLCRCVIILLSRMGSMHAMELQWVYVRYWKIKDAISLQRNKRISVKLKICAKYVDINSPTASSHA